MTEPRLFHVRARHEDAHHGRTLAEPSFEAAAVAYVEHLHLRDQQSEIGVIVRELASGHEHSFLIRLDDGEAIPRD